MLGGKQRVGEFVVGGGARVDGAAQVEGAAVAEARRAQLIAGDGDFEQRVVGCVCRLGAAKGGALNDDLERAGLVAEGRHRVLVDGGEGMRPDVGEWACASRFWGRLLCRRRGILWAYRGQRRRRGGFGARSPGTIQTLLPLIARRAQVPVVRCAVGRRLWREDEGIRLRAGALVARAVDGSAWRVSVGWTLEMSSNVVWENKNRRWVAPSSLISLSLSLSLHLASLHVPKQHQITEITHLR